MYQFIDTHTHQIQKDGTFILQLTDEMKSEGYFSIGIHPSTVELNSEIRLIELENQLIDPKCIAVGECGLDNRYVTLQSQEFAYIGQLKLSAKYSKPILLHCVQSWDRCRYLHSKYSPNEALVFHGFSRSSIYESVISYPQVYISFGERLLTDEKLQKVALDTPLHRLFLETDTSSVSIITLYECLAAIKNLTLLELTTALAQNFKEVFHVELARTDGTDIR